MSSGDLSTAFSFFRNRDSTVLRVLVKQRVDKHMRWRVLSVFFLLVLLKAWVASASDSTYQVGPFDKIFAVHFSDKKTGWAVGDDGLILNTVDGGESWTRKERITGHALNDITFVDNEGWVVGYSGTILYTNDGGKEWKRQESNTDLSLMGISFLDEKRGFALGERGIILSTEDGGNLWRHYPMDWMSILAENITEFAAVYATPYDIFFLDSLHGWIVGEKGAVLYSSDGGKHWELLRIGNYPSLYSVFFKSESEGYAVGQDGSFLRTEDGGKHWDQIQLPPDISKLGLFKIDMKDSLGVVVGDRGVALKSVDGGESWKRVALELRPPLPWLLDAFILPHNSTNEAILAGKGVVMKISLE